MSYKAGFADHKTVGLPPPIANMTNEEQIEEGVGPMHATMDPASGQRAYLSLHGTAVKWRTDVPWDPSAENACKECRKLAAKARP